MASLMGAQSFLQNHTFPAGSSGSEGEWDFLENASFLEERQDPPSSGEMMGIDNSNDTNQTNLGLEARGNLETLRKLLSSSTPGGTPDTLEPQQQELPVEPQNCSQQEMDIQHEIDSLLHFVDNFAFTSPLARRSTEGNGQEEFSLHTKNLSKLVSSQHSASKQQNHCQPPSMRNPLMDRTNKTFHDDQQIISSKMRGELLWNEKEEREVNVATQEPDGTLLCSDRSDIEISPNHRAQLQEEKQLPQEEDWEKFNQLTRQVENALQDANQEREATRAWARQVREAMLAWIEEQRHQVEQERAALGKERQISGSPQKDKAFYEAKIERLENVIRGLELDLKTTELHHQTNEKRLHNIIQYQQESYKKLEESKAIGGGNKSNSTPWSKHQAYVDNLESRTKELKDRKTPRLSDCQDPISGILQQPQRKVDMNFSSPANKSVQRKITFADNAASVSENPGNMKLPRMTTPGNTGHPHKPFGGITPGSVGLGKTNRKDPSKVPPLQPGSSASNASRVLTFANGARKEIRDDSSSIIRFANGDVQIFNKTGGSIAYYHAKSKVVQVATRDGSEIYEFPNGQVERHYPDGRKIVKFPDGTKKRIFPGGLVETFVADGKSLIIEYPDGRRDVKHLH